MTLTQVNLYGLLICTGIAVLGVAFRFRHRVFRQPVAQSLTFDDTVVRVLLDGVEQCTFRWDDVHAVRAWRQDALPVEIVRVEFDIDGRPEPVCIHEFMEGFKPFKQEIERRFQGIDAEWFNNISFPEMGHSHLDIWRRQPNQHA